MTAVRKGIPSIITTTTLVQSGQGVLQTIFCSASTSMTATIYDSATAATNNNIVASFPLTAGSSYSFDMIYNNGLYIVVGGSGSATVVIT